MTMTTRHLALVPRDGFFIKDGRGWHTSTSGRAHSLDWPWPSTVLGVLRSLWGRGEETRTNTTFAPADWRSLTQPIELGRTLVLRRKHGEPWQATDLIWPVPTDALWLENQGHVHRLNPVEPIAPTLGRVDNEAMELLWRPIPDSGAKPMAAPRWWTGQEFHAWLAGADVPVREEGLTLPRRVQVRVKIRPEEKTVEEGALFSHDVMETLDLDGEWAIGAEVELPEGDLPSVATLGAEWRLAQVEALPPKVFEPPSPVLDAFRATSKGLRLVATTPLCFANGWLPDGLTEKNGEYRGQLPGFDQEVILRAAFVPRPIHISGWDMVKNGPKPTSRMVAPGAVYFFERADGQPFDESHARALWLAAFGTRTAEGFGRVVPGIWNPTR